MLIPVRCFTCGEILANKWEYYHKKVKELEKAIEKKKGEDYEVDKKYKNFDTIKTKEILDELGLEAMCCRRHMLGNVDLYEII